MIKFFIASVAIFFSLNNNLFSQNPAPKHEFRGVWIATVINLDWPQAGGLAPRFQKDDLISKLDKIKSSGLNVVYFQIRTEGDALYNSGIEPWSRYLTGTEGVAPNPYWDPLEFVIEEAHKRGMELHAWINPYRAMRTIPNDFTQKKIINSTNSEIIDESLQHFLMKELGFDLKEKNTGTSQRDEKHVSNTHPEWLLVLNDEIAIFDPGLPEVIEYNINIVMDVVNRYDVDGIHFDDYFYPYPPNHMSSSSENNALDDSTFFKYPRGFSNKSDWRRNNIDIFVEALHDSIQQVKPWVKFGISPFGIWKNGVPNGISGMNAYEVIYGDGISWLKSNTIDYITPQLYWAFNRFGSFGQDYKALSNWWADSTAFYNRHIYPGHGLYRSDRSTFSQGELFQANEIPRQIEHNRSNNKILGSVFFRAKNITNFSSKGIVDSLKNNYYKYPSLQPVMSWKDTTAPSTPENLVVTRDAETENIFNLSWDRPSGGVITKLNASVHTDTLLKYAIYRVDSDIDPNEISEMENVANLIAVTGETSYTDIAPPSVNSHWYFVTAVSRNNVESEPTPSKEGGFVVSGEEEGGKAEEFSLSQNYPNPFNPNTEITFNISKAGVTTLKVYDMLGREVATLLNRSLNSGSHSITFDASNLSSGVYLYKLSSQGQQVIKKMTLLK